MCEDDIKIISKVDYQKEESSKQKNIFDNTIFEQIKGKELDLSVEKVLEIPTLEIGSKDKRMNTMSLARKNTS